MSEKFEVSDIDFKKLEAFVLRESDKGRISHSLRTGVNLYRLYPELGMKNAMFIGLSHDMVHNWSDEKLREFITKNKIELYKGEWEIGRVLHSPVGAFVLKELCSNLPDDWYFSIRHHTIPAKGMSSLGRKLFVADIIDPGRQFVSHSYFTSVIENYDDIKTFIKVVLEQRKFLQSIGLDWLPVTASYIEELQKG